MMYKPTDQPTASVQRRLEKASQYVNDLWFPVNSELLAKIKLGIRGGVYDLDPEALVKSLSSDFSLFTYCIRELIQTLREENITLPLANPMEALRLAGIDRLKSILEVEETQISKHSLMDIDQAQSLRLEELLVSSSSALALSVKFKIDEEVGYSASILRQLGHTLIAWNYPTVYKEALAELTTERSLDLIINERLGFSPTLLSIKILMDWGFPVQLCEALFIDDHNDLEESEELDHEVYGLIGGGLAKICSIGEALARANHPEIYPTAEQDWIEAKNDIAAYIGDSGFQYIQEIFQENLENYTTFMPELFHGGLILDPEFHLLKHNQKHEEIRNPYIILCNSRLASELKNFYNFIPAGVVSEESLIRLINTIIPESGFSGGLIYTLDPGVSMLVAQTIIGEPKLKKKESVDYSIIVSNADSIALALRSPEPIIEYRTDREKKLLAAISGALGISNRVGVLYLEISYNLFIEKESEYISAFKAFNKTICDCLNLD